MDSEVLKKLIHQEYPQENGAYYKTFKILYDEETPLRKEKEFRVSKKDKKPYMKKSTKRVDLSAFVQISERKYAGFYPTIGIEVKVTLNDLKKDIKFHRYIKYFEYFLFAVPHYMAHETKEYLSFFDNIGLISVDDKNNATLIKKPKINSVKSTDKVEILQNILVKSIKK